eukprot:PITA_36597
MENQQGRGEIPSFKNIVTGEASGSDIQNEARANNKEAPVMGKLWQMKTRGKCLPRANKKPRYWIYQRWKPKGHIELKLGEKGFFTTIFANLEDKERVFEEGPYFMNNAGLFMKFWEERYNPDNEKMPEALIWVRLFGLPVEFWNPEILEGIGNTIGVFVKVADTTKRGKYTSYARLCVYMNIAEPLPEHIELEYHDSVWQQGLDYEHIPFRCRRCHEYGHLYRQCPLNKEEEYIRKREEQHREAERTEETDKGFQQVNRKKKPNREGTRVQIQTKSSNIESQNKFKILQNNNEEDEDNVVEGEDPENEPMEIF